MMMMFLVVMTAVNSVVSVTPVSTNMNMNVSSSVTSSAAGNTVTKSEAMKPGTCNVCQSHCLALLCVGPGHPSVGGMLSLTQSVIV